MTDLDGNSELRCLEVGRGRAHRAGRGGDDCCDVLHVLRRDTRLSRILVTPIG